MENENENINTINKETTFNSILTGINKSGRHNHDGINSPKIKAKNLLGGSMLSFFTERDDMQEGDFTRDNTWRELTLGSEYADAKMLLINVSLQGTAGDDMKLSSNQSNTEFSLYANGVSYSNNGTVVPLDSSGKTYYKIDSGVSAINFDIIGYYK